MDRWTQQQIDNQRILRQPKRDRDATRWRTVEVIHKSRTPSWKRYGDGAASIKVEACLDKDGIPVIQFSSSETYFANGVAGEKRDTTRETCFTAHGPAALEIYEVLREAFEPSAGPKTKEPA